MSAWLVTKGNDQFTVSGLDELEDLTRRGELRAGDMIQPPGTDEWLYVSDIEELAAILAQRGGGGDDIDVSYTRSSPVQAIAGVLAVLVVLGGVAILAMLPQLGSDGELIGEGGLTYSQMMVTEASTGLRGVPEPGASISVPVDKDDVLELLSKRGDFYRARAVDGREGWIPTGHVIPMYQLGDASVQEQYDPLYNPERYMTVANIGWQQLPDERGRRLTNLTSFQIALRNESQYPMTDLVVQATIKDAKGQTLDIVEIEIDGVFPAEDTTTIGTLAEPDEAALTLTKWTFEEMLEDDTELGQYWTPGAEVEMLPQLQNFTSAEIKVAELRAIPDKDASSIVRRDD